MEVGFLGIQSLLPMERTLRGSGRRRCSEDLGLRSARWQGYNTGMFIRPCYRRKNGKRHAYWALMESYPTERGPRQRVVAYLGQLDEPQPLGFKDQGDCTINHCPNSTCSRYELCQPAARRLFFTPTFSVWLFFKRLSAVRRRMLKLASAWPIRSRD